MPNPMSAKPSSSDTTKSTTFSIGGLIFASGPGGSSSVASCVSFGFEKSLMAAGAKTRPALINGLVIIESAS